MWFVGALDTIFRLVDAWELLNDFEDTARPNPTDCRLEVNNISDFEFVGHRFVAIMGG
jgi:hypothetical protein